MLNVKFIKPLCEWEKLKSANMGKKTSFPRPYGESLAAEVYLCIVNYITMIF